MIKEAYCSSEVAKLLEEKGFDEPCVRFVYQIKDKVKYGMDKDCPTNTDLKPIYTFVWSVPTHQMAMAWLREKHNICITIYPDKENGYEAVLYDIENDVEIVIQYFGVYGVHIYKEIYEDAVEAALKYCLENLI